MHALYYKKKAKSSNIYIAAFSTVENDYRPFTLAKAEMPSNANANEKRKLHVPVFKLQYVGQRPSFFNFLIFELNSNQVTT